MRKIISLLLAILMLLGVVHTSIFANENLTVSIENKEIYTDSSTVSVDITIANNPGIAIIGFEIDYPTEAFELKSYTNGSIFAEAEIDGNVERTPFMFNAYNGKENKNGNGTLVTLNFDVKQNIAIKKYEFKIINVEALNIDEDDVAYSATNGSVTVKNKKFSGISFTGATYDYDGTAKSLAVGGTVPEGATVTYESDDFDENGKAINAGTYSITATVKKDGYDDWTDTKTLKINPKNLTITGLSARNKTYDGTDKATLSGGVLNGKISGDDVSATIPTEGKFSDKNAGGNKAVVIDTITLSGAKKDNYTLTQPTGLKANVEKAAISIKAKDKSMKVGGTIPTFEYSITDGRLFDGDTITGSLKTTTDGSTVGTFDIVEDEKFTAGDNYNLTFTNGTLTVSPKDNQNVEVTDIPSTKIYGDAPFTFTITDNTKSVGNITVTSSKPDVATVENNNGTVTVTIKKVGETEIRIFRAGNETYADFEKKTTLTIGKKTLKIKAKNNTVKQSNTLALPTLDNTWWSLDESTPLAYTDTIENTIIGTLAYAENATRKTIGTYAIKQGNLSAGDNYTIDFTEGTITVEPKTEQTITITGLEPKTYGDTFKIGVTSTSGLSDFTYSSDKPEIAMVSPDGTIEIKGIGIANISVTQAGNIEYAAKTETEKLVVNKKNITVTSIDIDAKTAVLDGILEADKDAASLDFDKITTEIGEAADETNTNVVVKGFELKGNKAANYKIITESVNITVPTENIVTITVNAERGTVEGAGKYIKGANVTLKATTNSGYKFIGWYNGEESVSENETYKFAAESDITLEAKFKKRSSGGGGSSAPSTYTVKFETNGGSKVESVKVVKNDTVNEPDAPTKDGFEFAGWFADEALKTKFNFSKSITGNLTVYAAWNEKTEAPKDDKKDEKNDDKTEEKNEETAKSKFNDVNDGDWFGDAVKYVTENKLMNGTSDETFAPYDNLTRAMLVTILYRAAGEPAVNKSVPFSDVTADSYFANAVIWAQQNGIVSGMTETEFAPDENITREQIATIIYRYAKAQGYDVSVGESTNILSYADFDEITEYAISAMQYAVGSGLLKGKTESTLNPKDNATRAEIATILQRFIEANK